MGRKLSLVSEGRGRLPGRGNRLSLLTTYVFLALALCLLLTDLFHLAGESRSQEPKSRMALRAANLNPAHHSETPSSRNSPLN
ncbi:MAG TPA: hypothetical protein VEU96_33400 [Bryobacteraceae bacterium]|nr:hypothetical protein [Bryobacteraceae bacterium]